MATAALGINVSVGGPFKSQLGALEGAIKGIGSVGGKALAAPVTAIGAIGKAGGAAVGALGGIGLAAMGVGAIGDAAKGAAGALGIGLNSEIENVRAQLTAFTKSGTEADKILGMIRNEAAATPFAFREMAAATASLLPASKQSGVGLMQLVKQAEILAALNPSEGLEGAAFSLREALSGDFVSIVERFNLPRQRLNELKAQGVPAMEAISTALREMGADASLVTGLAGTFSGRLSTFQDTIDTLRQRLSAPLFKILSDQLVVAQKFFDDNADAIGAWVDRAGQGIAGAARAGIRGIGTLVDGITSLQGGLSGEWMPTEGVSTFAEMAGRAGVFLADMRYAAEGLVAVWQGGDVFEDNPLYRFVPFLQAAVPVVRAFVDTFVSTFQALGTAVQTAMGGDVVGAITGFLTYFVQSRATLVQTLASWGAALVEWVAPFVPPLLAELSNLLSQAFAWVQAQAPAWTAQLASWGQALAAGIGPMVPVMLSELSRLAGQLFAWVAAQAPGFTERLFSTWIPAFIGWVIPAGMALFQELSRWWNSGAGEAFFRFAFDMGAAIVTGIIKGLYNLGAMLNNFILDELSKLTVDLGPAGIINLGEKSGLQRIEMAGGTGGVAGAQAALGVTPAMAAAAAVGPLPTATDPTMSGGPTAEQLNAAAAAQERLNAALREGAELQTRVNAALAQVPDQVRDMHSQFMAMA